MIVLRLAKKTTETQLAAQPLASVIFLSRISVSPPMCLAMIGLVSLVSIFTPLPAAATRQSQERIELNHVAPILLSHEVSREDGVEN